ncbi:MAG: hypothetical protein IE931_05550 [Sphingobacteriales bacterium]|nr:hypothetical protein [Sphingobacteriales bacterium]
MELKLLRFQKSDISTIGKLLINGVFECYTLEDKDRGLQKSSDLSLIQKLKVYGKTAIPTGRYEVVISYSNRFKKSLPLLLNVPGYAGIRIHPGNDAEDTEGCLLVGQAYSKDFVANSRLAFQPLLEKIEQALKTEKVYITIESC